MQKRWEIVWAGQKVQKINVRQLSINRKVPWVVITKRNTTIIDSKDIFRYAYDEEFVSFEDERPS